MRIMSIMAHPDDFEYTTGGLFALLRRRCTESLHIKIMTTSRGAGGHHSMSREETFRHRETEARKAASLVDAEYECLKGLDGEYPTGLFFVDENSLGGLWNAIREFNPDIIFCPPVISDPLAGIHVEHYNTAMAVRMVSYLLTVPHAFPSINTSPKSQMFDPIIINVDDSYDANAGNFDFAVDISEGYKEKEAMLLCHSSQVLEWSAWQDRLQKPYTEAEFKEKLAKRHQSLNERYGQDNLVPREYFRLTRWGKSIPLAELKKQLCIYN